MKLVLTTMPDGTRKLKSKVFGDSEVPLEVELEERRKRHQEIRKALYERRIEFTDIFKPSGEELMRQELMKNVKKEGDCWIWTKDSEIVDYEGKKESVYKVSYIAFKMVEVPDDKSICHKCETERCINPNHLYACSKKS